MSYEMVGYWLYLEYSGSSHLLYLLCTDHDTDIYGYHLDCYLRSRTLGTVTTILGTRNGETRAKKDEMGVVTLRYS